MSFFNNLFKKATDFIAEQSKNLENQFDKIKENLQEFVEQQQNPDQQPQNKVFKQVFDNLDGAILKFQLPDGSFIFTKNYAHCKGDYSDGRIESHYDIVNNNALQILDVTYNGNQVTEVSHKICEFADMDFANENRLPRLHTDMFGVVVIYTHKSIARYNYKIDSKDVERICYDYSNDIGLYTDKDPRNSFKIVEQMILPNFPANVYHTPKGQEEREQQIAQKMAIINAEIAQKEASEKYAQAQLAQQNKEFALMHELSLKPLESVKESIAKYGLPKEKSFVTKYDSTIYFDGELIYWNPAQNGNRGYATYISIKNENDKKYIHLTEVRYNEDGEIRSVSTEKAPGEYVICKPHDQDYGNFYFDSNSQCYTFVLFATWGVSLKTCYSAKIDSEDSYHSDTSSTMFLSLHSLEDIYALAGRIFFALSQDNQPLYANFLSEIIAGTFVKMDYRSNSEDTYEQEEESNDYANNSNSPSSSSKKDEKKTEKKQEKPADTKPTKAKNIAIKVKNDTNDEVHVYNLGSGGSYRLQKNIVTTIKMDEGDKLTQYGNNKRVYLVADPSMDGKVQLISKL